MKKVRQALVDNSMKRERNKAIIEAYLKRDRTLTDIANEFKICRERVRQIIGRWEEDPAVYD